MNSPSVTIPIRGDLLSCYTASIAGYMERNQIDHQMVLGTQLFLAIRADQADAPKFTFVHYHTPLLGDTSTHALHLVRREAHLPDVAMQRIMAHWKQTGSVIVVGDAMNLPWLVTHGRKHAPHWFLLSAIDEVAGYAQVVDLFEFIDAAGTQLPFVGKVDLDVLGTLAQVNPVQQHVFQARDQWAFGVQEQIPVGGGGYQWFEQQMPPAAQPLTESLLWELLLKTWMFNTGQQHRDDLLSPEWACGVAAIQSLAQYADHYLDDPSLYDISDDLWVAARNRQMFMYVLCRLAKQLKVAELEALAIWGEAELVAQWHAVPRIMHYNLGSIKRGRRPSALLVQTLHAVAELEAQLMERLGNIVLVRHYEAEPLMSRCR